jgi:hypothetical protein
MNIRLYGLCNGSESIRISDLMVVVIW